MSTYVVETTINPGVSYEVDEAEYQQLLELGLLVNGPVDPVSPGVFDSEVAALVEDPDSQTRAAIEALGGGTGGGPITTADITDAGSVGIDLLKATAALEALATLGITDELDAVNGATALPTPSTLAERDASGRLQAADGAADDDAANVGQLNAGLATKADAGHTHTAADVGAVEAVTAGLKMRVLTQTAYDGLGSKDATTLYVIQG